MLNELSSNFQILEVIDVRWSKEHFSRNLSRFYGQKLPDGSHKERHCGTGDFLIVIVLDCKPRYGSRETSKGCATVNVNSFDAKMKYRQWTGGGHRVHASNTPQEARHDLALLLGQDAEEYISNRMAWHGQIIKRREDLVGADGWKSFSELLYVLNKTIDYVVLRNFRGMPNHCVTVDHGDVDLQVSDKGEAVNIVNGNSIFRQSYRVHYAVSIGASNIAFDFRYVGDQYYDARWQNKILENRVMHQNGFYVPDLENYFFSLLYHALVHKKEISKDYADRLRDMAITLNYEAFDIEDPKAFLDEFMTQNGYRYVDPMDLSVFFNAEVVGNEHRTWRRRFFEGSKARQSFLRQTFKSWLMR